MRCSKCGFDNPNGFEFCGQCGAKIEVNKCPDCGFVNPESFKFCCKCGAKLINKCPNCDTTLPSYGIFCPECGTRVRGVEPIDAGNASGIDACPTDLEFVVGSCRFKMIKVEGGTFTMGATAEQEDDADDDERPIHKVTLSDYYIGQTEVTQALWEAVMDNNPSEFKGDNLPVENVCWVDCQAFIQKLNSLLSKQLGGKRFALPTEAQWEFAARGGNKNVGYKYAGSNNIDYVAWYFRNSCQRSHPVAQKQPNELGIYDMNGNVYEWCKDWDGGYSSNAQTNPEGPTDGKYRVLRGGGWGFEPKRCRVSNRNHCTPGKSDKYFGLRLCLIP